jgi:hypothetical protein
VHRHEDFQVARRTVQQLDEAHETGGGTDRQKSDKRHNKNTGNQSSRNRSERLFFEAQRLRLLIMSTMLTF